MRPSTTVEPFSNDGADREQESEAEDEEPGVVQKQIKEASRLGQRNASGGGGSGHQVIGNAAGHVVSEG